MSTPSLSALARAMASTALERFHEAGLTTGIEIGCVIYGIDNGWFNLHHPNGYTKGWAIVGQEVQQWQFGAFILTFCLLRGPVILFGPRWARFAFALVALFVSVSVGSMISQANPDSPVIPTMLYLAKANAWISVSLLARILGFTPEMFWTLLGVKGGRRAP